MTTCCHDRSAAACPALAANRAAGAANRMGLTMQVAAVEAQTVRRQIK